MTDECPPVGGVAILPYRIAWAVLYTASGSKTPLWASQNRIGAYLRGGLGPVDGVRPSDLEDPLGLRPDAVLTLAVGTPVQCPDNRPPLEVAVGTLGPAIFTATDHPQVSRSADVADVRH